MRTTSTWSVAQMEANAARFLSASAKPTMTQYVRKFGLPLLVRYGNVRNDN